MKGLKQFTVLLISKLVQNISNLSCKTKKYANQTRISIVAAFLCSECCNMHNMNTTCQYKLNKTMAHKGMVWWLQLHSMWQEIH